MGKLIDITNNKFGKLTALERRPKQGKKTMWLCQCECGSTKVLATTDLRSHKVKSCGCLSVAKTKEKILDFINSASDGQEFMASEIANKHSITLSTVCSTLTDLANDGLISKITSHGSTNYWSKYYKSIEQIAFETFCYRAT